MEEECLLGGGGRERGGGGCGDDGADGGCGFAFASACFAIPSGGKVLLRFSSPVPRGAPIDLFGFNERSFVSTSFLGPLGGGGVAGLFPIKSASPSPSIE